jgi:hypothetical protein
MSASKSTSLMRDFNAVLVFLNSRMAAGSGYFFQHSNVQSGCIFKVMDQLSRMSIHEFFVNEHAIYQS